LRNDSLTLGYQPVSGLTFNFNGTRWLLLKNPENLKESEKESLNKLLKINKRLFKVYILRDEFRQIFSGHNPEEKIKRLSRWIQKAKAARVKGLSEFVDKIIRWKPYIQNALIENVSNSYAEGVNTKIRVIQRKAYGYKDFDYFKLKVIQQFNFNQIKCIFH
jgi:transposase